MEEKKIKGRKRHLAVDSQGLPLCLKVHAANVHDTMQGGEIAALALKKYPSLLGFSVDAGYRGTTVHFVKNVLERTIEVSQKIKDGWAVLAKRWIVERSFAWLNGARRLSKDFEIKVYTAENMIRIAFIKIILAQL